jgi:hypothetical protein
MKTDDLIRALAQDGGASRPSTATRMLAALALGGTVTAALFALSLGVRPDIAGALLTWRFAAKVAIAVVCFAAALRATVELARPDGDQRVALLAFALPVAMLVAAVIGEAVTFPAESWPGRAIGSNARLCLAAIPALSIAPLAALLVALRAGAPQFPAIAGAMAGLLAGGLAATLYALHCVDDSPLFVALWYVPAVALIVLIGAAAGSRILRW